MGRNVGRFATFAECGNNRIGGMRRTATLLTALAAAVVAMPTHAPAQDFPGAVFRTLTTPFRAIGRTIAPRRTGYDDPPRYVTAPLSLSPAAKRRQQSAVRATPRPRGRDTVATPAAGAEISRALLAELKDSGVTVTSRTFPPRRGLCRPWPRSSAARIRALPTSSRRR